MEGAQICFSGDWNTPLGIVSFFSLMMALASLWVKRTPWVWGTFLVISLLFGYQSKLISALGFLPIAALLLMHLGLKSKLSAKARVALVLLIVGVSICLFFHLLPGFHNWLIAGPLCLGSNAVPYNFWMNYDKPFVGIFTLALLLPLLKPGQEFKNVAKTAIPLSLLGIVLLMWVSIQWKVVQFDFKIPSIFWLWPIVNLFLVVIPEEGFLRGFVQEEIFRALGGKGALANIGCVVIASLLFALLHIKWVASLPFLSLVFVAGIVYGGIYQYTKSIEAAIFCHFSLNFIHFFFFTYPALQG